MLSIKEFKQAKSKGSIPGGTTFQKQSECSAVGSALRSGRRGRAFESPHSDRKGLTLLSELNLFFMSVCELLCRYVIGMRAEAGVLLSVWKMEFA